MKKRIGIVGIQGLPAMYGAFEQTVDQLTLYALINDINVSFEVACSSSLRKYPFDRRNVVRSFSDRKDGAFVLIYLLKSFAKLYLSGVRNFVFFGYSLAPLFWLFTMMGCNILCNVDGFEWRRAKWGRLARCYFRFCEWCAGKSSVGLVFDAHGVKRYYGIHFGKKGVLAFYGIRDLGMLPTINGRKHDSEDYAISIMRLEPENNIETIVRAFSLCPQQKLMIVGPTTSFFDSIVAPIVARSPNIHYVGPVYDRDELNRLRRNAKFYVHGHSVGGTNPTLLEAVEAGNPIVAFNSIFNREVLGENGVYFGNVDKLKSVIDEKLYEGLCPPVLNKKYTWEYVCNQYLSYFKE